MTILKLAKVSTVICLVLTGLLIIGWLIGEYSGSDRNIVFAYLSFIGFLFISIPLHLFTLVICIVAGVKEGSQKALFNQYCYIALWFFGHLVVFLPYLSKAISETANKVVYEHTHNQELALYRTLSRQQADPGFVRQLIADGVDVNHTSERIFYPPLTRAARQGSAEVVEMLINAGAEVNNVTTIAAMTGMTSELQYPAVTALDYAAVVKDEINRRAVVAKLLESGADPKQGYSILGACAMGDVVLLETLLIAGAEFNVKGDHGRNCTHLAAYNNHERLLIYLIQNDMVVHDKTKYQQTPLDEAINRKHEEAVLLLVASGFRTTRTEVLERFLNEEPQSRAKNSIRELHN